MTCLLSDAALALADELEPYLAQIDEGKVPFEQMKTLYRARYHLRACKIAQAAHRAGVWVEVSFIVQPNPLDPLANRTALASIVKAMREICSNPIAQKTPVHV
jgi:hypothetical protein